MDESALAEGTGDIGKHDRIEARRHARENGASAGIEPPAGNRKHVHGR
jgi:hypothetical protein